jgi:RNA-directed DNA polymerase
MAGHYTLREIPKKFAGSRLLMVPLPRMKAVQRELLAKLVNKLPIHESAHGFHKGRGTLSGANCHADKSVVICTDIQDFFPCFTFRRVAGYFRYLGYGRGIAVALGNLTTERLFDAQLTDGNNWNSAIYSKHPELQLGFTKGLLLRHRTLWRIHPELPQGAPTSPGIANAICWRMDKRLSALARKFGGEYTRYADDLTFSGGAEMSRNAGKLLHLVRRIVKTEGLALNEKKTRIMRRNRQQRVTGIVVNEKPNLSRRDFDRLKAILHNCIKQGPQSQNRENHPDFQAWLRGKIAHWQHIAPERGRKLLAMYEQIRWQSA